MPRYSPERGSTVREWTGMAALTQRRTDTRKYVY
jgi:hypothetical protein